MEQDRERLHRAAVELDRARASERPATSNDEARAPGRQTLVEAELSSPRVQPTDTPGKHTLAESLPLSPTKIAARSIEGLGGSLPFHDRIQASFGRHDISSVRAHVGGAAGRAARQLGARAFAFGNDIAFDDAPDLHTAAHEAAHYVQQRAGIALKGDIDQVGDAFEQHADEVADAVVRGDSAEPLLDRMAGRGVSAMPASPTLVQRKTGGTSGAAREPSGPSVPQFVDEHRAEILRAIATRIMQTGVPTPHPRLPWSDRAAGARAVAQAIRAYVDRVPEQSLKRLMALSYPADLFAITADARRGAGGVPVAALAIATAFDVPLRDAIVEMGMRLRVYLDEHGAKPEHAAWLVASNPLHGLIAEVLLQRGLVILNPTRSSSGDTPGRPFAKGVREVSYEWMGKRDPNLWNWIRVTFPKHATAEDVAHTPLAGGEVTDGSEQAYRIAASPPYFGIPFETAKRVKEALAYAPPEIQAQVAIGPGPRVADASALSKSTHSDDAALAQARLSKRSDPPTERALARCEVQMAFLHERLAPWRATSPLAGANAFLARRAAELGHDPRARTRWQGVLAAQERVLHAVASELAEILGDIGKRARPAEARKLPAVMQVIEAYARAAGVSHLGAQAGAALASARQVRVLLPLALAEGATRVARHEVQVQQHAEQDAGFVEPGGAGTANALPGLMTRAADLRLAAASGKHLDPATVELLAIDADETALRARIQTIQTRAREVDRLADEVGLSKERFEGGLPTMRAVADELLYRQIPHWKQLLDDGATWKGPAGGSTRDQTTAAQRRRAVTNVEHLLTNFDKVVEIGAYLTWAHARIEDERLKHALVDLALQFGIMFVTGQAAGATVAAMRTLALGANIASELRNASFAMKAAEVAIHAGLDTVGQGLLGGPVDGKAFAENALGIIVSSAAMKPFQSIFHDSARLEREVDQGLKTWTQLAKRAGKLGAELAIDVGVSVTSTHVVGAMMRGGELSIASSDELISQGLAIATSKFVGQRVEVMRQRMSKARQERGLRELDELLARVDTLGKRARTAEVSPSEALGMLRERHALLEAELKIYRRLATSPDTKAHATEALAHAKADANLGEGFIDATLRLAKLSPVVDGERYEGTPKQIKDALAAVQATGSVAHSHDKNAGVLRIQVGDKTIEITEIGLPSAAAHRVPIEDAATSNLVGDRSDMRWQMEDKNRRLAQAGQAPRYGDLDAAVNTGMNNLAKARAAGHPYGFKNKEHFQEVGAKLKRDIATAQPPSGGRSIPIDDIVVQGSALHKPEAKDVDIAILVRPSDFNQLLEQSFPKEMFKVRSRGTDPFTMTVGDAQTAAEKTLAHAVASGKITRDKLKPKLRAREWTSRPVMTSSAA